MHVRALQEGARWRLSIYNPRHFVKVERLIRLTRRPSQQLILVNYIEAKGDKEPKGRKNILKIRSNMETSSISPYNEFVIPLYTDVQSIKVESAE